MGEIIITSDIIWAIISLALLYGLQEVLLERKSNHYEKEFVKRRLALLEQNYEQLNSFYKENAKLYHDMNHHFHALYYLLENGEQEQAKKYLEEITTPLKVTKVSFRTGIDMLDVILQEMEKRAEENDIKIDISVKSFIDSNRFRKKDLCLLMVNLMDNAMEAAKSQVSVCIRQVHAMLFVEIRNDYRTRPYKVGGRFLTTKKEALKHGWGIQIMENIVDKYDGSMEYRVDDMYVSVEVMLNAKDDIDA